MKIVWLVFTLIPAPFLFHFYEYGEHIQHEEAPYLLHGSALAVVLSGFLAGQIRISTVVFVNIFTVLISVALVMYFIPDDGWFKPVGRTGAVVFTGIVYLIGQLIIRSFSSSFFNKRLNH
ncbi:hypothetical protein B0H99_103117 [Planomicrobium soli]|uniref:Uncharacterized protein n=1 Tax=Planomicrobium soli TaxID=1176648 RepID=A0A2P8H443_9BACL|nr:hypothetical protein [Planomicrobium soli]PSL40984.1 hypothetical protein B0H99_103117 [Planomicrobium soli]